MQDKHQNIDSGIRSKQIIGLIFIALWVLVITTGMRQTYLYTESSFYLRIIISLLLFGLYCYFVFIHRFSGHKNTSYKRVVNGIDGRLDKIKKVTPMLFGAIFLVGGVSWTSIGISAWAANLFSATPYMQCFQINKVKSRGTLGYDLKMSQQRNGNSLSMRLSRPNYTIYRLEPGDEVCVEGRTSLFGTIIDHIR